MALPEADIYAVRARHGQLKQQLAHAVVEQTKNLMEDSIEEALHASKAATDSILNSHAGRVCFQ